MTARMGRRRAIKIDDIDPNRGGEAGRFTLPVDLGDQLVHVGLPLPRDLQQGFPHDGLKPHARAMAAYDDIANDKR
jgi:hypothetical protein